MSKATITFEDDGDELKMSIEFEGGPSDDSIAHVAAAACYVQTTKKLQEGQDNAGTAEI